MKVNARAIITNEKGEILLSKRAKGVNTAAGLWCLLGGNPEENENITQTVIREVKEEVNLDFEPIPYIEKINVNHDATESWKVYYFTGTAQGQIILDPNEVEEIIYVTEKDLDTLEIAFEQKDMLKDYFQSRK